MVPLVKTVAVVLFLQFALVRACYDVSTQSEDGTPVHFDYTDGPHGPAHWGELKHDWEMCKTGHQQSPIHVTAESMTSNRKLGKLDAKYRKKLNATIANDGHAVVVDLPSNAGYLKIDGVTYRPVQFHFHMSSEHVILNQSFPLELHLVHKSEDGKLAVIAFLFVEGEKSEFLAQFTDKLPSYKTPNVKTNIGKINLLKIERNYGRYMGSLTTPPCKESVTWTIMLWNFPTVSSQQLKDLQAAVPHTNNRPTFPSHGRGFHTNF